MAKEIERKFLVASDGWRDLVTSATTIRQGYVASWRDRSVRVRIRGGDKATLTVKIGESTLVRDEFEYQIPIADAEEILSMVVGRVIEKTRHLVPFEGSIWEVDVFEGVHAGLVIAEIEMSAASDNPVLPGWLGQEVTGDRRYSNQALATLDSEPDDRDGLSI